MAITFTCECGKEFRAKDELAGRREICPACRREFVITAPEVRQDKATSVSQEPSPFRTIELGGIVTTHDEHPEVSRPFYRDPVVVIGAAIPSLILAVFFGYLAWPRLTPERRKPNVSTQERNVRSDRSSSTRSQDSVDRKAALVAPNEIAFRAES